MSIPLIVIFSLAFPLIWTFAFIDRQSLHQAAKLKESIGEILIFIGEWENDRLNLNRILLLKSYPPNLSNRLRLIRGYTIVRFTMGLPRKSNLQTAINRIQQFYECIWESTPGFRVQADALAQEIKTLLK